MTLDPRPIYSIGTIPTLDRDEDGSIREGEKLFRHNDGALNIMRRGDDPEDVSAVLIVPRAARLKRGAPYDTPDPIQEAFAQRVVDLLNASEAL